MEVKIGVQYAPRELMLESAQTPAEVEQAVTEALAGRRCADPDGREGPPGDRAGRQAGLRGDRRDVDRPVGFTAG